MVGEGGQGAGSVAAVWVELSLVVCVWPHAVGGGGGVERNEYK